MCAFKDLKEGEPLGVELGKTPICVAKVGEAAYAISDICSHAYAKLSTGFQEGNLVFCPLHAASFDVTNGKFMDPPAEADLPTFGVKIENGEVFVDTGE